MLGTLFGIRDMAIEVMASLVEEETSVVEGDVEITDTLSSVVQISGGWDGALVVSCSRELARGIAAAMFEMEHDEVAEDEVGDAFGEVANMMAGCLKAMLPEGSKLGIPDVVESADVPSANVASAGAETVSFECGGHPLKVSVFPA